MRLTSKSVYQYLLIIVLLSSLTLKVFSQNNERIHEKLKEIQNTLTHAEQIEYSEPDSAIYYYNHTLNACELLLEDNSDDVNILILKAYSLQQLGWCNSYYKSDFNSGKTFSQDAIEIYKELRNNPNVEIATKAKKGIGVCYSDQGVSLTFIGNSSKALEFFHKSIKVYEEMEKSNNKECQLEGKKGLSKCYTNIGLVYSNIHKFELALDYLLKSQYIDSLLNDSNNLKSNYINIGNIYSKLKQFEKSNDYYYKSLKNAIQNNNLRESSICYINIGSNLKQTKSYTEAIKFFKKSLEIDSKLGDKMGLAINYNNLASLYLNLKDYTNTIKNASIALDIATEINTNLTKYYSCAYLYASYDSLGDYSKALYYHKLHKETNDSLFNETSSRQIKEIEAKYQSEKKQLEIDNLTKNKALKEIELERQLNEVKRQSLIIYSFLFGFLIIVIFSILLYRQFVAKKKANILLSRQNIEIQMKNEEIEAQRDEIEAQRDLVVIQKNKIEEIHNEITSSIRYAERIQKAILPADDLTKMFLANHFIFYKPRDIVSGDFYWSIIKKNWLLVAVADCTGHGVPGAFMSMLGISYLNEISAQNEFISTSVVLEKLRNYIIKSLHQKGHVIEKDSTRAVNKMEKMKDGMDISLIAIDLETYKMQFSGANNPVYIVHKTDHETEIQSEDENKNILHSSLTNFQLEELKGDKMPIAIHIKMDEFSAQNYQLCKGDTIYLFSDGFADQFGGSNYRKYMYKNFKELLLSSAKYTMNEQKIILENELTNWIGQGQQIDDVTILGMRIS